jgi:polyhydroxyalkanoate synthase subunit PhaC
MKNSEKRTSLMHSHFLGIGKMYKHLSNKSSAWNNDFIEPIRDTLFRTPSKKICAIEKYSLFHYNRPPTATEKGNSFVSQNNTPVLVIYAYPYNKGVCL